MMPSAVHKHANPKAKENAAISGVIVGGLDTLITGGAMVAASSSVLLADCLKTTLEFVAVLLSWMALRRIRRGSKGSFDYGLDKLENLSSLFVGLLMMAVLCVIGVNAVLNLLHPSHISGPGLYVSIAAQVAYAFINSWLWIKNRRLNARSASPILESQVRLFFTKAVANVFILVSLVSSILLTDFWWAVYIDPFASLAIAASILLPAMGTFSSSVNDLLDRTIEESQKLLILRELGPFIGQFSDLHGIRSRKAGSYLFIDILLEFEPEQTIGQVQGIIDQLQRNIEQAIPSSRVTIGLCGPKSPQILHHS